MQPICSAEHLGTSNKGMNMGLLWLVALLFVVLVPLICLVPRVRVGISRLIDWWPRRVWYRIDAALTAQEKRAEVELAEWRKSGRRLPWWRRLFY